MRRATLTLRFASQQEADYVYGQLSDGFGENELDLGPARGPRTARTCTCKPIGDDWERRALAAEAEETKPKLESP